MCAQRLGPGKHASHYIVLWCRLDDRLSLSSIRSIPDLARSAARERRLAQNPKMQERRFLPRQAPNPKESTKMSAVIECTEEPCMFLFDEEIPKEPSTSRRRQQRLVRLAQQIEQAASE